jgi:hypothetical protein
MYLIKYAWIESNMDKRIKKEKQMYKFVFGHNNIKL